jgi:serine-type D-Ala-D-Ala carboxypeptidase/endopeptidase
MSANKSTSSALRSACAAGTLACLIAAGAGAQAPRGAGETAIPSDQEIRKILAERVEAIAGKEDGVGIVAGVIGPQGRRVISYGHLNRGDARPLDGETVFEIGSVGKVFTALLLEEMVQRGEVALADPAAKYLPAGVKLPERNGRSITLADLATHTSGLPFMPDAVPVLSDSARAKYGAPQVYEFLARAKLESDPGAEWDYSNLGYWLLGQALASRAGVDFESLMRARVIAPLKLTSTAFEASPEMKARLAAGHDAALQPAPPFSSLSIYAAMPAAGGLLSTVNDMLTFLSAAMGYEPSPLAPSMAAMLGTRRPMHGGEQALGWVVVGKGDDQLVTHEGGTWGYVSYVAWDPRSRVGVVLLSNQTVGVGDIARHLLRPDVPLETPVLARHAEIALAASVLDSYAGRYEAEDEGVFQVIREADFLVLQLPAGWGLPRLRLRPESVRDFFVAELPVRATFQIGGDGRVSGMLVYPPRGQKGLLATRISPVP